MGLHRHDEVVLLLGAPGAGKGTQARFLAATPKRPVPVPDHHEPEGVDCLAVAGHVVVGEMPAHHAC